MSKSLTGISFPFRIGVKGGVVMSTSNDVNDTHVIEGMRQLLQTRKLERCMETDIYSDIDTVIFEPNDTSAVSLVEHEIKEALKKMDNIKILGVNVSSEDNILYALIQYENTKFDTVTSVELKVGEIA